ncbi:hypothetical protein ACFX2J_009260 [Malus domestica]
MLHATEMLNCRYWANFELNYRAKVGWGHVTHNKKWCSTAGTCCFYAESSGAIRTKLASECVLLVFVCPWCAFWVELLRSPENFTSASVCAFIIVPLDWAE